MSDPARRFCRFRRAVRDSTVVWLSRVRRIVSRSMSSGRGAVTEVTPEIDDVSDV